MHIAQFNIGRARYALDDPQMSDFMGALAAINALAERTPGFVWRLKDDTGEGSTGVKITEDPRDIVNMTVWETPEALEHFTWNKAHARIYNRRASWFEPHATPSFVMWPIEIGTTPTPSEGLARLAHLNAHGSTDYAYAWDHLPHLKVWLTKQCG